MKKQWQQLAQRIDAMQLRERVFLFLALIIGCLAVADTVWLTPAQAAYKQATQSHAAQGAELQRLRDELKAMAQPVDASKAVRDEIAAVNLKLQALNDEIKAVAPLAQGGPAIEQALVQFLHRQEGLTLVRTGTMKQQDTTVSGGPTAASLTAAASAPAATPALASNGNQVVVTRRGLELTVSGPYAELTRYVQTLENALPTLRWGTLQLKATRQPPEMTLQVYVVGASQ